jgi:hypothetical protein
VSTQVVSVLRLTFAKKIVIGTSADAQGYRMPVRKSAARQRLQRPSWILTTATRKVGHARATFASVTRTTSRVARCSPRVPAGSS